MRRSKVISISVCATFFIVSTLILFVVCYLSKATPNMNDELFVPASVKEVPEEQDIAVQIHPISVVDQTLREKCAGEFRLSDIQKGWMTNLYDGNCRLIFELKNSSLKDFVQDDGQKYYFYAEIVPRNRLNVYDVFALMGKHNSAPFSSGDTPKYYPDSVESAITGYYMSRCAVAGWVILNALVIVSAIVIGRRKKD